MLYNVIGYDNQIIGQVEAGNVVEAWGQAGKKYKNILDVRLVEVKQVITPIDELYTRELMDKVTRYELSEIVNHLSYEPEIQALQYEPYLYPIYSRDETKVQNIEYLIKWMKRYPGKIATRLIIQRLEEKVKEKEVYPVRGPVSGTRYITWEDFTKLPGYPLIARAVNYPHDYRRKCSPYTKDGYISVDAIYNMSAWAGWKSSSLDPIEKQIADKIHELGLYQLMQLNKGRRQDQPALFPERLLPI